VTRLPSNCQSARFKSESCTDVRPPSPRVGPARGSSFRRARFEYSQSHTMGSITAQCMDASGQLQVVACRSERLFPEPGLSVADSGSPRRMCRSAPNLNPRIRVSPRRNSECFNTSDSLLKAESRPFPNRREKNHAAFQLDHGNETSAGKGYAPTFKSMESR
jgi:hypothetical protein